MLYAIDNGVQLTEAQRTKLFDILNIEPLGISGEDTVYVAPRPGMKTPSSSKIADVLEACGVKA